MLILLVNLVLFQDVCLSVSEETFVKKLLSTLVASFLKCSESADSDACAFALQEVTIPI